MKQSVISFLIAAIMAGCGTLNVPKANDMRTCEDIAVLALHALLVRQVTPEQMRDLMAETFKVPAGRLAIVINADHGASVSVHSDGIVYSVEMQDSEPIGARILFETRPISIGKAISCVGEPQLYRAYYAFGRDATNHRLSIDLFIPSKGVEIYATTYGKGKIPPTLTSDIPVVYLSLVVPSTLEATMADLLRDYPSESDYRKELESQLKPWPGNWEDIHIEIDPALR